MRAENWADGERGPSADRLLSSLGDVAERGERGWLSEDVSLFVGLRALLLVNFASCARMLLGLSNAMPISCVSHLQNPQAKMYDGGPASSRGFTERGAVHMGQLKQFLAHLDTFDQYLIWRMSGGVLPTYCPHSSPYCLVSQTDNLDNTSSRFPLSYILDI